MPIYREGRLLYRLPGVPLVGLIVPIAQRGQVNMTLHLDFSQVSGTDQKGMLQVVQSEVEGDIIGGFDLQIGS